MMLEGSGRRRRRGVLAVLTALVVSLGMAQGAGAATLFKNGTGVTWSSGGVTTDQLVDIERTFNFITFAHTGYSIQAANEGTTVNADTGCTPAGDQPANTLIQCPTTTTAITIDAYNGDDTVRNAFCPDGIFCLGQSPTDIPVTLIGRGGDDSLEGGIGDDTLIGDLDDTQAGNDTLMGGAGKDSITGRAGNDTLIPGLGDDGLVDGGLDTDRISYDDGRTNPVNVTLANTGENDGGVDDNASASQREDVRNIENVTGTPASDTIDGGSDSTIRHAFRGLDGNDTLLGSDANDSLAGDDGNDTLVGRDGADTITGGDGDDTTSYSGHVAGVTVNLAVGGSDDGNAADGAGDTTTTVENVSGTERDDVLTGVAGGSAISGRGGDDDIVGGAGNDVLNGGSGDDSLSGLAGTDTITGGTGADAIDGGPSAAGTRDVVDYSDHAQGVTVTLVGSAAKDDGSAEDGAPGARDSVNSVEEIIGSEQGDTMIGDDSSERFQGNGGDDLMRPGGGADILSGGAGAGDTYDNSDRTGTVEASLDETSNEIDGDLIGTTLERIIGGSGNDLLSTDVAGSELLGGPGDDRLTANQGGATLRGDAGRDNLLGGAGNDTLDGGADGDTINGFGGADSFFGGPGDDNITADDGVAEGVDCGDDTDFAATDGGDTRVGCELPAAVAPPIQPPPPSGPGPTPQLGTMAVTVSFNFFPRKPKKTTRFTAFKVKNIPRGSKVVARCVSKKGKKCKGKLGKSLTKRNARGSFGLKLFNRKFRVGSRLEIVVTNPTFVSQIKIVSINRNKGPSIATRCQQPGSKKRIRCGS